MYLEIIAERFTILFITTRICCQEWQSMKTKSKWHIKHYLLLICFNYIINLFYIAFNVWTHFTVDNPTVGPKIARVRAWTHKTKRKCLNKIKRIMNKGIAETDHSSTQVTTVNTLNITLFLCFSLCLIIYYSHHEDRRTTLFNDILYIYNNMYIYTQRMFKQL